MSQPLNPVTFAERSMFDRETYLNGLKPDFWG